MSEQAEMVHRIGRLLDEDTTACQTTGYSDRGGGDITLWFDRGCGNIRHLSLVIDDGDRPGGECTDREHHRLGKDDHPMGNRRVRRRGSTWFDIEDDIHGIDRFAWSKRCREVITTFTEIAIDTQPCESVWISCRGDETCRVQSGHRLEVTPFEQVGSLDPAELDSAVIRGLADTTGMEELLAGIAILDADRCTDLAGLHVSKLSPMPVNTSVLMTVRVAHLGSIRFLACHENFRVMSTARKPEWLRMQPPRGREFADIRRTLREHDLYTVCEEASCPNMGECWSGRDGTPGTATFMIMGDTCTRTCGFCDVATGGGDPLDQTEPANVASAVAEIGLDYVVITSVDRDDLADQGAPHFARTIREVRQAHPEVLIEVLIPDFQGETDLIDQIIDAHPDVIAHNVETVERLQPKVRDPRAGYEQSLSVLERVKATSDIHTKSSIMLGHGEYDHEVYETLVDLRAIDVDIVTLGQYLQPSHDHLAVEDFVHPLKFTTWQQVAEDELEFLYCASGPMVRTSYKAGEFFIEALLREGSSPAEARAKARASIRD